MGRYVRCIVLLLLLAIAVYLGIRFYSVWKAAGYLSENMDLAHYSYELEVELDQEEMQKHQGRLFEILAGITGFEPEDMCRLTVRGSVWEDTIHALIYPEGAESPLIELYLGSDTSVINETYIYNAVRNHLAEKFQLLGLVMPEQKESLYMTLEQVEKIFGLDLKGVRSFSLRTADDSIGTGQYFIMLAVMDREKATEASRFTLETEKMGLEVEIPEGDSTEAVSAPMLRLHMDCTSSMEGEHSMDIIHSIGELTGLDEKAAQIFSQMGFPVSGEQFSMVKSFSVAIVSGGSEITMPTNFVNQNVVELIYHIRELVKKLGGGNIGETGR